MAHDGSDHSHHIVPQSVLLRVFGMLVFLTIATVVTARFMDLGMLDIPVALGIAATKSFLVVAYFMMLRYDKPINTLVFVVGTLFVGVFLVFTLLDTAFRGDLDNSAYETISEQQRREQLLREREPDPQMLRVAPGEGLEDPAEGDVPPPDDAEEEAAAPEEEETAQDPDTP